MRGHSFQPVPSYFFVHPLLQDNHNSKLPEFPYEWINSHKGKWIALFGALSVFALFRTVMLCVITWLPHSCETNMTQINTSEYAEIPAELDSQSRYFRVTNLLYVIYSLWSCPKYIALGIGLLLRKSSQVSENSENNQPNWCVLVGKPIAGLFLFFASVSFATIAVGIASIIVDAHKTSDCREQMVCTLQLVYQISSIPAHSASPIIRLAMVVTVFKVRAIWFNVKTEPQKNKPRITEYSIDTKDEKRAISRYFDCVKKYEERVTKIKPFLQVFQAWFVFQWLHYFFQGVINLTRTLYPWITGTNQPLFTTAYYGIYTVYDTLAFGIPHVCGLKINAYHEQYLRDERKKLLKKTRSQLEYVKAYSMKIEKSKYADFVPKIPFTGIQIPLDSTGYTLGILFTIFAVAGSFVSFNA